MPKTKKKKKTREGKHVFGVSKDDAGTRLDIFLAVRFQDLSRSWLQELIGEGNVRVGRRKPSKSYKLKEGERVSIKLELPEEISLEPEDSLRSKISVVFENEDFVVINKPAGVVVHPAESHPNGTLVNWLLWKYPEVRGVGDPAARSNSSAQAEPGEQNLRPGIVHRLDKDTSGLMVAARNQKTFNWLKERFKKREVEKKYFTLVVGIVEDDNGVISYPTGRSRRNPIKQVAYRRPSRTPETARDAETSYKVLKRFPDFTLLEVMPKTGRKHQIRVHLSAVGHPVAQDTLYGGEEAAKPKHLGRMFLHASSLRFSMPSSAQRATQDRSASSTATDTKETVAGGEVFSFTLPLPPDLENALKNLPFMVR